MTLNAITLDQYFHNIINQPRIVEIKEPNMFDIMKAKWTEFWTTSFKFVEVPDKYAVNNAPELQEDAWVFGMSTGEYEIDGEVVTAQEDIIVGDNNGTWMETLDHILDIMSKHYGYNIKEQVYYSVAYPLNHPDSAGYGRELNDEVLQKLLLSFPEVYEVSKPE
jgi:hypothetical protein